MIHDESDTLESVVQGWTVAPSEVTQMDLIRWVTKPSSTNQFVGDDDSRNCCNSANFQDTGPIFLIKINLPQFFLSKTFFFWYLGKVKEYQIDMFTR